MGGSDYEKLVEYGVARFGNLKDIIADEPLALLAAIHYFTTETPWSLSYLLIDGLCHPNEGARGIAFEQFGVYLLALAFRTPTRLSKVLKFAGKSEIRGEVGQLVAIHLNQAGEFVCHPVDITSDMRPTCILGRSPRTENGTLSWLKDPKGSVLCFPAHTVGPDLILLLQLSDSRIVRVLVQFKYTTSNTIGPSTPGTPS